MKFFIALIAVGVCQAGRVCEEGWTLINRTKGGWCVKGEASGKRFDEAEEQCSQLDAVVSSIESQSEMEIVSKILRELPRESHQNTAWIGAQLKHDCIGAKREDGNFKNTGACGRMNAYRSTDGFTKTNLEFANWVKPLFEDNRGYASKIRMSFEGSIGISDATIFERADFVLCGKRSTCSCS